MIYRRDGLIFSKINDNNWANPKIARILPTESGGSWGSFLELKDTKWAMFIDSVSTDSIDRALRGDCTPLMKEGLRDPRGCLKRIPIDRVCSDSKHCTSYEAKTCTTSSKKTPECFSLGREVPHPVRILISAWKEGYYVIREREENEIK